MLTGFKPFLNNAENPSGIIAESLDGYRGVSGYLLDVSYTATPLELRKAIDESKPDFILSLGLHAKAEDIHLERCAYNLMDGKAPDNDGVSKMKEEIIPGGPESLMTRVDLEALSSLLSERGYPNRISTDPGRYICNETYFLDLSILGKALFVHLPNMETMDLDSQKKAVMAIIDFIADSSL